MPPKIHRHQFVETSKSDKTNPASPTRPIPGVVVVCVECGEARRVFEDGEVRVQPK